MEGKLGSNSSNINKKSNEESDTVDKKDCFCLYNLSSYNLGQEISKEKKNLDQVKEIREPNV